MPRRRGCFRLPFKTRGRFFFRLPTGWDCSVLVVGGEASGGSVLQRAITGESTRVCRVRGRIERRRGPREGEYAEGPQPLRTKVMTSSVTVYVSAV